MDWVMTIGGVLVAWSALRVLGNERQRRLEALAAANPPAHGTNSAHPALPPGQDHIPVIS